MCAINTAIDLPCDSDSEESE